MCASKYRPLYVIAGYPRGTIRAANALVVHFVARERFLSTAYQSPSTHRNHHLKPADAYVNGGWFGSGSSAKLVHRQRFSGSEVHFFPFSLVQRLLRSAGIGCDLCALLW